MKRQNIFYVALPEMDGFRAFTAACILFLVHGIICFDYGTPDEFEVVLIGSLGTLPARTDIR